MKKSHHYRFFVSPYNIKKDTFSSSDRTLTNQIKNVFRLKKGDQITVLDGVGQEYTVVLNEVEAGRVGGQIIRIEKG